MQAGKRQGPAPEQLVFDDEFFADPAQVRRDRLWAVGEEGRIALQRVTASPIVAQGGELHFRGGRGGEVKFQFDGVEVSDPLFGQNASIANLAVAGTDILSGGFDASRYTLRETDRIQIGKRSGFAFYRDPRDPGVFNDAALNDLSIRALTRKVRLEVRARQAGDTTLASCVTVHLKNGRSIEETCQFFPGMPQRPLSPYAVSKVGQDMLGYQYWMSWKVDSVRTRGFNHEGPRRGPVFVASDFAKQIADIEKGRKAPVLHVGNLDAKRDFTDVRDMVRAYVLALEKCEPGEVYNIGAGNEITNKELTYRLLELTGRDESFIRPVDDRKGHDRRYSITHDKVSALGWRTEHTLDAGLAATVEWYRNNREWWEPLKAKAAF